MCLWQFHPRGTSRPESMVMATELHIKNTGGALEFRCSLEKQETLSAPPEKESVFVFDLAVVSTIYLS